MLLNTNIMNTRLSVNVNKLANKKCEGANNPDIIDLVTKIESYGANGITIHPRPDERHITQKMYIIFVK